MDKYEEDSKSVTTETPHEIKKNLSQNRGCWCNMEPLSCNLKVKPAADQSRSIRLCMHKEHVLSLILAEVKVIILRVSHDCLDRQFFKLRNVVLQVHNTVFEDGSECKDAALFPCAVMMGSGSVLF